MENRGEVVQEEERRNNAGPMSVGRYDVGNSVEVAAPLPSPSLLPPPKLKLAGEVMNYFNEFTGVTRWRLVDYPGPLQFANLH